MKGHVEAHGWTLNCGETREAGVRSREFTKGPFGFPLEKKGSSNGDNAVAIPKESRHAPRHTFEVKPICLQSSGVDIG